MLSSYKLTGLYLHALRNWIRWADLESRVRDVHVYGTTGGHTETQRTSGCLLVGQFSRVSWGPFDKGRRGLHRRSPWGRPPALLRCSEVSWIVLPLFGDSNDCPGACCPSGVKLSPVSSPQQASLFCWVIMDASSHLAKYYCWLVCVTNLMEHCRQTGDAQPKPSEDSMSWKTMQIHVLLRCCLLYMEILLFHVISLFSRGL